MLTHIKKYWIAYLVLVVVVVAFTFYNWGMIKGWFMSEVSDGTPRFTADGSPVNGSNLRASCPVNCLIPSGTAGLYKCASPCNISS